VFILQGHKTKKLLQMPMKMWDTNWTVTLSSAHSQTGLPHKAFSPTHMHTVTVFSSGSKCQKSNLVYLF